MRTESSTRYNFNYLYQLDEKQMIQIQMYVYDSSIKFSPTSVNAAARVAPWCG